MIAQNFPSFNRDSDVDHGGFYSIRADVMEAIADARVATKATQV
jgi:hypothetical protein